MNKLTILCCSLLFTPAMFLVAGCEQSDDTGQQESSIQADPGAWNEPDAQNNSSKSNNRHEDYTSANRITEPARSIKEGHEDVDVLTPQDAVMAHARYHRVTFYPGDVNLSVDEENDLKDFVSSLDEKKSALITVRMEDADTLDVTEPTPEFKKLTAARAQRVANVFQRGNIEIAEIKVDESGIIEAPGEDKALARTGGSEDENDDKQLVVVVIGEAENS